MATVFDDDEQLKAAFKSAIIEVLHERKDLIRDIIEEIIEDAAFSELSMKLPIRQKSAVMTCSKFWRLRIEGRVSRKLPKRPALDQG